MASGVYRIYNKTSGHIYVGSSIDVETRWKNHRSQLGRGIHHCIHLQRAWAKYGEDDFIFQIIEFCSPLNLIEREQYFIDTLRPEYNIALIAGNTLGVKHTEEAKRRMSMAKRNMSAETRAKMSAAAKGKIMSEETRARMSASQKGRAFSEEHLKNLSIALKGKTSHNKGKKASAETCEKMRKSMMGKTHTPETKAKISAKLKGQKQSEETNNRRRESMKEWWRRKRMEDQGKT